MLGPPESALATPFVTVMSPNVKPETDLLNVAVTVNGDTFVGSGTAVDKTADGAVLSIVQIYDAGDASTFPEASVALTWNV